MNLSARRMTAVLSLPAAWFALAPAQLEAAATASALATASAQPLDFVLVGAGAIVILAACAGIGVLMMLRGKSKQRGTTSGVVTREAIASAVALSEFGVHFQPVVDRASGDVVGAEALVRWEHPGAEAKTARQFFSRAASAGVLDDVMAAALPPACEFAREVLDGSTRDFQLHVNLSKSQIEAGSTIVETLQRALRESQLVPWALQVEITEQDLVEAGPQSMQTLQALSELGLNIAVDDFWGQDETYWVLALPGVTGVKLDLRSNTNNEGTRDLLANAARIAHSRKLVVTGKRVESSFEVEFAAEIGCDLVQGHAYGRPMSVEAFREFVTQGPVDATPDQALAS